MRESISYFIKKSADWIFRKRSPALYLVRVGAGLAALTAAGSWAVNLVYKDSERSIELGYQSSSTTQVVLSFGFFFALLMLIVGTCWEIKRYRDESRRNEKKKTIVIEQRGLVDTSDSPLVECVKSSCSWQVDSIVIDIRERIIDNVITRPDLALAKVNNLKMSLSERTSQYAASDISIAYGGVFPVPLSFYSGYLLDDESKITLYDWDRDRADWRLLAGTDDKEEFEFEKPSNVGNTVVLAVSVSYPVDRQTITEVFSDFPIHYISLPSLDRNNHWSKDKQDRLSGDFLEYCKMLLGSGVDHIHLILACQNSVAFRFGQAYDKRNLPTISVYQYERQQPIRYPWCLHITHQADVTPNIVQTDFKRVA